MDAQLTFLEGQIVPAAEAMPNDKYSFAPHGSSFDGVRTFALEVKHVATANIGLYSAILGQDPPAGVSLRGLTNGPDSIQTKDQILKYLKDSFALGHKALATLTRPKRHCPACKIPNTVYENETGSGDLQLGTCCRSLWSDDRVLANERDYAACEQWSAACKSIEALKRRAHLVGRFLTHLHAVRRLSRSALAAM